MAIEHITDTTPMVDPRSEPSKVNGFVVGDIAFFLLTEFDLVKYDEVLPAEVIADQGGRGVFAYFDWVQRPGNRELLQQTCLDRVSDRPR